MSRFLKISAIGVVLATLSLYVRAEVETYRVHQAFYENLAPAEFNYKGKVLMLALEKSREKFGPYAIEPAATANWTQNRAFHELESGAQLDVLASMTNVKREQQGLPVRYCLYKGLLGIRIGMGTKDVMSRFEGITRRDELDRIRIGQVFDWPDFAIQKAAGLNMVQLSDMPSSYQRLRMGSFDLFPLGMVEVEPIARGHGFTLIKNWAIAYPTAYYFFVSKARPELAARLEYGFEQALKDGSFDALFNREIGPLIERIGLGKRTLFRIPNPQLPKETPLARRERWHPLIAATLP
jgi:hypothetical protein